MKDTKKTVREFYGKIGMVGASRTSCCVPSSWPDKPSTIKEEEISRQLGYSSEELSSVPEGANLGLGCGNPQAIAALKPGEVVLDLGSGGGFDCFLAAQNVGENGKIIGVDMTPEMLERAKGNAEKSGIKNVEFRLGEIEHLPVADNCVDVVMSNCVINLSPDKSAVYKEAFRVLRSGGRLAISDIVATAELPEYIRNDIAMYAGCVAGAATVSNLEKILTDAGFHNIRIQLKDQSREIINKWMSGRKLEDYIFSATIEAIKP